MANVIKNLSFTEYFEKTLLRLIQSGNINFIIGSGASYPAIKTAGNIENKIQNLLQKDEEKANEEIFSFLTDLIKNAETLINKTFTKKDDSFKVLDQYQKFLEALSTLVTERRNNLHPKRVNLFSTNYDLFVELASENVHSIILNDGFERTPNLNQQHVFNTKNFFNTVYNSGNLFNYRVEIPNINLIKLHGSFSWNRDKDNITFGYPWVKTDISKKLNPQQIQELVSKFSIIVPQKGKFRETLLDRTYYDLMRIFANELDKENSILFSFGFSFEDEHIRDITIRALKNPTLQLVIFSYSSKEVQAYSDKFKGYQNVTILDPGESFFDFKTFNDYISNLVNLKIKESK